MPKANTNLLSKMHFVHVTTIIPRDGVMIPGARVNDGFGFSSTRTTLHWNLQNIVQTHSLSVKDKPDVVIIEPAHALVDKCVGGYIEDIMTVGPHKLSAESVILVPLDRSELAAEILGDFKGKLIRYYSQSHLDSLVHKFSDIQSLTIENIQDEGLTDLSKAMCDISYDGFKAKKSSKEVLEDLYSAIKKPMAKDLQSGLNDAFKLLTESLKAQVTVKHPKQINGRFTIIELIILQALYVETGDLELVMGGITGIQRAARYTMQMLHSFNENLHHCDNHGSTIFYLHERLDKMLIFMISNRYTIEDNYASILSAMKTTSHYLKQIIELKLIGDQESKQFMIDRIAQSEQIRDEFYRFWIGSRFDLANFKQTLTDAAGKERSEEKTMINYYFSAKEKVSTSASRYLAEITGLEVQAYCDKELYVDAVVHGTTSDTLDRFKSSGLRFARMRHLDSIAVVIPGINTKDQQDALNKLPQLR